MDRSIVVVDAHKARCRELCTALEREHYQTIALHSLVKLDKNILECGCRVVILDLDSLPVDDRYISKLRQKNPGLPIMGLSSRPHHPELQKAMSSIFCACLRKPLDLEELIYCIRSFCEKDVHP